MRTIQIFTPVIATIAAVGLFATATMGGVRTADVAQKTDRFAMAADQLCEGQAWPNLTSECLAWKSGEPITGQVRYVTTKTDDFDAQETSLVRSAEILAN